MKSVLLDCFRYNDRHTEENVAKETTRIVAEWSISEKVVPADK